MKAVASKEYIQKVLLEKIQEEKEKVEFTSELNDDEINYKTNKANVVSLFSGAGGLDLGVEIAGLDVVIGDKKTNEMLEDKEKFNIIRRKSVFNPVYANDYFAEALESYKMNFPEEVYLQKLDIRKVKEFPKSDLILGGFPCPGFSEAGPRLIDDERNFLYIQYIRGLIQSKPKFFIAENVKGMLTLGKGEVFKQIKEDFEAAGYKVYHKLVNARDYGVPQLRERVFLIGVRNDIDYKYEFPTPSHGEDLFTKPYVTLRDAIYDLKDDPGDYFTGSFSPIFMSRNRKKSWDEQSFTIQASGRQAPIHPGGPPMKKVGKNEWVFQGGEENNRRLSVKEIARIQTFPDWFEFSRGENKKISKNGMLNKVYKQIGNAVPVELARAIARPIAEWFYNEGISTK